MSGGPAPGDISERLAETIRGVLDRPDLVVTDELAADDVDGWDSVAHVELIFAIEEEFGIAFAADEILRHDDVGTLRCDIERRLREGRP